MRKLLGVSIAAMLAVSPMMANAAQSAATLNAAAAGTASTKIATTTYVKGAYKVLADAHDAVVNDITVTGVTGEGNHITNNASVAENLKSLNTAIKNLSGDSSQAVEGVQEEIGTLDNLTTTQQGNLVAAINEVDANTDNNTAAIGAGSSAAVTTAMTGTNYVSSATSVIDATKTLDTQVKNINDKYIPLYGDWESDSATGSVQINALGTTDPTL